MEQAFELNIELKEKILKVSHGLEKSPFLPFHLGWPAGKDYKSPTPAPKPKQSMLQDNQIYRNTELKIMEKTL